MAICNDCGYERISCYLSADSLRDFYSHGYWEGKPPSSLSMSDRLNLKFPALWRFLSIGKKAIRTTEPPFWISEIFERVPKGGRVLEFGAGRADLCLTINTFSVPRRMGYKFDVMEFGDYWSRRYRKLGYDKIGEDIESINGSYDLICSSHVFEHLIDPVSVTKTILRCLNTGGMVLLFMPNESDSTLRKSDAPHVTFWTPETLAALLSRCGFENIQVRTIGPSRADYAKDNSLKATWGDSVNPAGEGRKLFALATKP